MTRATHVVRIRQTAEQVFALVGDPSRDAEWNPNAVSVSNLSGGPSRQGSCYSQTNRRFGEVALEVKRYTPPRVITIDATSKQGLFTYSFFVEGDDGETVLLRQEAEFVAKGLMKIIAPLMWPLLNSTVKTVGGAATHYLETGTMPPV